MRENVDDKTIMLVEDDLDEQVLTLRALKKNGIGEKVVVAQDGVEALDRLLGTGEYAGRDADDIAPRLVLLDLKLPKVDGLEVLRRLRADERTMSLPVVVLTSSQGEQDMIDGYGSYADGCICRSVDFTQFSRAMRQLKPLLDGTERTPAEEQRPAA
jgi:two-component system response regulator